MVQCLFALARGLNKDLEVFKHLGLTGKVVKARWPESLFRLAVVHSRRGGVVQKIHHSTNVNGRSGIPGGRSTNLLNA